MSKLHVTPTQSVWDWLVYCVSDHFRWSVLLTVIPASHSDWSGVRNQAGCELLFLKAFLFCVLLFSCVQVWVQHDCFQRSACLKMSFTALRQQRRTKVTEFFVRPHRQKKNMLFENSRNEAQIPLLNFTLKFVIKYENGSVLLLVATEGKMSHLK